MSAGDLCQTFHQPILQTHRRMQTKSQERKSFSFQILLFYKFTTLFKDHLTQLQCMSAAFCVIIDLVIIHIPEFLIQETHRHLCCHDTFQPHRIDRSITHFEIFLFHRPCQCTGDLLVPFNLLQIKVGSRKNPVLGTAFFKTVHHAQHQLLFLRFRREYQAQHPAGQHDLLILQFPWFFKSCTDRTQQRTDFLCFGTDQFDHKGQLIRMIQISVMHLKR